VGPSVKCGLAGIRTLFIKLPVAVMTSPCVVFPVRAFVVACCVAGPLLAMICHYALVCEKCKMVLSPSWRSYSCAFESDASIPSWLALLRYAESCSQTDTHGVVPEKALAGYHTLVIDNVTHLGRRQPGERLRGIPFDFRGKTVLDIGCNQGGMLFELSHLIASGVGIDFNRLLINTASRVRRVRGDTQLDFYTFDLAQEPLDLIRHFVPSGQVDIVFMLSVCLYLPNCHEVINAAASISDALLFESNGWDIQQRHELEHLRAVYSNVRLVHDESLDDKWIGRRPRKLYFCIKGRADQLDSYNADSDQASLLVDGYEVYPKLVSSSTVLAMTNSISKSRVDCRKGGYVTWKVVGHIPEPMRTWSETIGVELCKRALSKDVRLLGAAGLW